MYRNSDSDSKDSDEGIRFKTESIRNKVSSSKQRNEDDRRPKDRHRHKHHDDHRSHSRSSKKSKRRKERRSSSSDDERYYSKRRQKLSEKSKRRNDNPSRNRQYVEDNDLQKGNTTGPALPPHVSSNIEEIVIESDDSIQEISENNKYSIGPALPPDMVKSESVEKNKISGEEKEIIGPSLPPNMLNKVKSTERNENHICKVLDKVEETEDNIKDSIGPVLPPCLLSKSKSCEESDSSTGILMEKAKESNNVTIGPTLPPHLLSKNKFTEESEDGACLLTKKVENIEESNNIVGPALPPNFVLKYKSCEESESGTLQIKEKPDENEESNDPPNLPEISISIEEKDTPIIGPALPMHLRQNLKENSDPIKETSCEEHENENSTFGPQLPPHLKQKNLAANEESISVGEKNEEDNEEEMYGPLPPGMGGSSRVQIALEERAMQLKLEQLGPSKNEDPVREEWMMELPENRASNLGLGPRQFRSKAGPDMSDRSCWTDTPEDKAKKKKGIKEDKVDLKSLAKQKEIETRNREQEEIVKKHKKKKQKTLLEIHQKKLKKQKKDAGPEERKPFSRENDLQVNRFDEAQKKAVLKKAQLLDDRFAQGQSKFI